MVSGLLQKQQTSLLILAALLVADGLYTALGVLGNLGREYNPVFNWIENPYQMILFIFIMKAAAVFIMYHTVRYLNKHVSEEYSSILLDTFIGATALLLCWMFIINLIDPMIHYNRYISVPIGFVVSLILCYAFLHSLYKRYITYIATKQGQSITTSSLQEDSITGNESLTTHQKITDSMAALSQAVSLEEQNKKEIH